MTEEHKIQNRVERNLMTMCASNPVLIGMCVGVVTEHHFLSNVHSVIWSVIIEMYKAKEHIEILTIHSRIKSKSIDIPLKLLITATNQTPDYSDNENRQVAAYADILIKALHKTELRSMCNQVIDTLGDGDDIEDALGTLKRTYDRMIGNGPGRNHTPFSSLVEETIEDAKKMSKGVDTIKLQKTNIKSLDARIKGLGPGEVFVVAARPGAGKTEFVCLLAYESAVVRKEPILILNYEIKEKKVAHRILKYQYDFSNSDLRSGKIEESVVEKMEKDIEFRASPIYIIDANGVKVEELSALIRKYRTKCGVKLVAIDYLQLMKSKDRHLKGEEMVSALSHGVKAAAMENDVPIILLAQLNRATDARPQKRPQLEDLKGSGAIEADADMVGLIWSPGKVNVPDLNEDQKKAFVLFMAKFRDGGKKDVELEWNSQGQLKDPKNNTDGTEEYTDEDLPF